MKLKTMSRSTLAVTMSLMFALPQMPTQVFAANDKDKAQGAAAKSDTADADENTDIGTVGLPTDLFPIDIVKPATDAKPRVTISTGIAAQIGLGTTKPSKTPVVTNGTKITDVQTTDGEMEIATVPAEYSCPLFESEPHKDLIGAIDSLSKQVASSPECSNDAAASTIDANTKTIKDNVTALAGLTQTTDPSQVNIAQIETTVTAAIQATQNLGEILNNNTFLNSRCGRQTMSTGQALLSLNSIINGIAPYALFAVSMNAALLPALPFVIGGIAVTSGISVVSKMYAANQQHMESPEYRKALLQNTCQFIKVARKVRFMQLAQSGQIDQITKELDRTVLAYKSRFGKSSGELFSLLKYKDVSDKQLAGLQTQLLKDKAELAALDQQVAENNDDLMMCVRAREMVNSVQDGVTFPVSAINNLEQIAQVVRDPAKLKAAKLQATTFRTLNEVSKKQIVKAADEAATNDAAWKTCANAGRSWINGVRQAITKSAAIIDAERVSVDAELSQNAEYRQWKAQYYLIKREQVTVARVEKAMEELSKDNSLIDRSELEQRMVLLKNGMFGSSGGIFSSFTANPPVLAWLTYTKSMHDRAISDFLNNWQKVYEGALSFTSGGKTPLTYAGYQGGMTAQQAQAASQNIRMATQLKTLTLENLPLGSRQNEIACQQLETTWLNWTAALDHLGATQLYCNMIDGVLDDANISPAVTDFCRGRVELDETVNRVSAIDAAKTVLIKKGYQTRAQLISAKLKELQCAMPAVSVMNQ